METDNLRSFLKLINSSVTSETPTWIRGHCPLSPWKHHKGTDNKPSFGIRLSDSFYKCFSCDSSGDTTQLINELKNLNKSQPHQGYDLDTAEKLLNNITDTVTVNNFIEVDYCNIVPEVKPFSEDYIQQFIPTYEHPYLTKRGIQKEVARDLDIRYDFSKKRICFPIYDYSKKLVGLHGRDITGNSNLPYLIYRDNGKSNLVVWYGEHWLDFDKPIVLTESVFDLAKIYHCYKNVACSLTASLSKHKIDRIQGAEKYITFFDSGDAANKARAKLDKYLKGEIIHIVPSPEEDDAGNMEISAINDAIKHAIGELDYGSIFKDW